MLKFSSDFSTKHSGSAKRVYRGIFLQSEASPPPLKQKEILKIGHFKYIFAPVHISPTMPHKS